MLSFDGIVIIYIFRLLNYPVIVIEMVFVAGQVTLTHTRLKEWACQPQVMKYLLYDFKKIKNKCIKIIIFRRRQNYEKHAQPEIVM